MTHAPERQATPQRSAVARLLEGLSRIEAGLGRIVEAIAAILVAAEVVVLFTGVFFRYVLESPLVWSDELASTLFLWLAMLGSAVALRRGEHMRMAALVSRMSPPARARFETIGATLTLAFVALLLMPAYDYASSEVFITTPALQISGAWRASALPVGIVLMLISAVARLLRRHRWQSVTVILAALVALGIAGIAAEPLLNALGNGNLVLFFVLLLGAGVLSGTPIAVCFGFATLAYLGLTTWMPLSIVVSQMNEGMSQLILLAVPMFVFLGTLIEMTGMGFSMVRFLGNLLGHVRGGLSYVLLGAMYLVSGISGAKAADMAAIAPVLLPEMEKRGADRGDLLGLLAASGAQTETIPPSLVLITIGSVTGLSIAALFTAGMLPAIVVGACLCVVIWRRHRHLPAEGRTRAPAKEIARTFVLALPALILPFVIRGAVIEGVATATEVSTIGIFYTLVYGIIANRGLDWRRFGPALVETACLSSSILFIIGAATAMGWALIQSGFSTELANAMAKLPGGGATFLAVSVLVFIVIGSLLEGIPAIVLFGPLMFPIARELGVNEIHYAMVVILAMGIGLFAPPFGVGYYAAAAVAKIEPDEGMRSIVGYLVALFVGLVIVTALPIISTVFL